ncbi:solute carrier family 45 member 3-like [Brachionichthys hirsutus]|uniref:solute carrier family 45 member 3-like n=1 Tax=Brachionichthys hirsutus TaxID=412623 RepID=UPI0036051F3D
MRLENPLGGQVWRLILVNMPTCGLEACLAAGTVYIPPLLLQAGLEEHTMTMALAVSPVLGLVFIPMLGSASDSLQSRCGRRRPFIWVLFLGVLFGMQIIPHTWYLATLMSPQNPYGFERVLLAGAVCLLDVGAQAALTLLLALLSDLFPKEEENRKAFAVNCLMTSLGACLGFLLPAVDWSDVPIATYLGGQKAFVCATLTIFCLICFLTTVFIKEENTAKEGSRKVPRRISTSWKNKNCPNEIMPGHCCLVRLSQYASACMSALPRTYKAMAHVPTAIWRLCVADMFNWTSIMTVMLFFGEFMGEGLYNGAPNADPQSQEKQHFEEGVRMASVGLFLQSVVGVLCSAGMHYWVALLGSRVVYISGAVVSVLATLIASLTNNVTTVIVMMAVTGYSTCVFHVVSRTLLCLYHSEKQVFFPSSKPRSQRGGKKLASNCQVPLNSQGCTNRLPLPGTESPAGSHLASLLVDGGDKSNGDCPPDLQRGIGFDMALLDGAYLLSQILPAMFMGFVVEMAESVRAYMASACCFGVVAVFCSTRVIYSREDLHH